MKAKKRRKHRPRVRYIGDKRFTAERPGYYVSNCGRWVAVHMLAGTVNHQWELFTTKPGPPGHEVDLDELIDTGFAFEDFVWHAERGEIKWGTE